MLIYKNNSDTVIIVLHEIYGINKHIVKVCQILSDRKYDVAAPNFLKDGINFRYEQEAKAYSYFMNEIGLDNALIKLTQILISMRPLYKRIYVLGYSIGATLAWLCSQTNLCDLVIGFYGSRIRDNLAIIPQCPTLLFFPTEEQNFDVDCLINKLNRVKNISIKKLNGKHGFADPFSKNYNNTSTLIAHKEILLFLESKSV